MTLVLEKGMDFESADKAIQKGLVSLFNKEFANLKDLQRATYLKDNSGQPLLPKEVFISRGECVCADDLPFTIKRWPIYYFEGYGLGGLSKVAEIKVV